MKEPLVVVDLPSERQEEVEERFRRALAPLGPMLADRLRRGEWRRWTLLPEDYWEPDTSLDGGFWADWEVGPTSVLSQWIADFLRREPGRIVIFENDPARKGDPWIQKCTAKFIYLEDRVYLYAGSGASADEIGTVIRKAASASWGMGMVVESSSSELPEELSEHELRELASKAMSFICDAFDGVSWVVAEEADGSSILPEQNT